MPEVEVTIASPRERGALESLIQLYTHDFSEHWAGTPDGDLGDDGRFASYPLDPFWREATHVPLLLRVNERLAGFALLDDSSHTGRGVDRNMAEFFVVRKYRRDGVGSAAARTIFDRYPGQWETAVARRNVAALAFWRKVVTRHPSAREIEESDVASPLWNGPVIRFRIQSSA